MRNLASLQRAFQHHVVRPGPAMKRAVLSTRRANAARRLAVYASAYRLRLAQVLANDYPRLAARMGEKRFARLARDYIAAHPSRHPNLRWFGKDLARFLQRGEKQALAELASVEWAVGLAFDAADAPILEAEQLALVPPSDWPTLQFELHPSVQLLGLRHSAIPWIVWRKGFVPRCRAPEADEAWALRAVMRGRNFAQICVGLRRFVGGVHAARRGAQLLRNWLAEGLLSAGSTTSRVWSQGRRRTSRTRMRGALAGA